MLGLAWTGEAKLAVCKVRPAQDHTIMRLDDAEDQRRASTLLRLSRLGSQVESLRDFLCLRSERIFRWGVSEANEGGCFDTMTVAARIDSGEPRLGRLQKKSVRQVWAFGAVSGEPCGVCVSEGWDAVWLRLASGLVLARLSCLVAFLEASGEPMGRRARLCEHHRKGGIVSRVFRSSHLSINHHSVSLHLKTNRSTTL